MDSSQGPGFAAVGRLSSLDDPVRQRLYAYVASCDEPVSREDAASAVGISRTLAAYHLDKLAEAGLLTTGYSRPAGRGGPGAGRPAKRYARSQQELSLSVPPRNYALLASLLADAVDGDNSGAVWAAIAAAARKAGREAGEGTDVMGALQASGYEPALTPEGEIELRNCPFHHLAEEHTELVCGLNLDLVTGLLQSAGGAERRAELAPRPGRCCVRLRDPEPRRRSGTRVKGGDDGN